MAVVGFSAGCGYHRVARTDRDDEIRSGLTRPREERNTLAGAIIQSLRHPPAARPPKWPSVAAPASQTARAASWPAVHLPVRRQNPPNISLKSPNHRCAVDTLWLRRGECRRGGMTMACRPKGKFGEATRTHSPTIDIDPETQRTGAPRVAIDDTDDAALSEADCGVRSDGHAQARLQTEIGSVRWASPPARNLCPSRGIRRSAAI